MLRALASSDKSRVNFPLAIVPSSTLASKEVGVYILQEEACLFRSSPKPNPPLTNFLPFQASDAGNVTKSTLRYQPKAAHMGEMLRCRAENPVMPASQIEDTWSLDINCECRVIICSKFQN